MRDVAIIGIGSTNFGKNQKGIIELGVEACNKAIADAGIGANEIQCLYLGNFIGEVLTGQAIIAAMVAKGIGLGPVPVTKVEGACASGGIALRQAFLAVATGEVDLALAAGTEKMSAASTSKITSALAGAFDQNLDGKVGTTFPGFFALCFNAYMQKYGVSEKYIHQIAVKSRENAVKNPVCYLRKPTTVDDIMLSYPVAEPLHMADCCPISDGAAAVVLCPVEMAKEYSKKPVKILSVTQTLGTTRISDMPDMIRFDATIRAAQKAYKQAGINAEDVDVAELHDCFTIAEVIDSEDLGFFKKGEGALAAADGETKITGRIPINPSGGLLSRGHPVGATGLAQVYEIVKQLRGEAVNQVPNPEIGLTHNLGGPAAVCTVSILQKI
ncbi:acetyl-CoA C-acetyltransferase [Desulfotomaculum arcticum]|uniref:propanoyl-CoA C-acyltransferase n=1 Tax=Desulfotruncus arcticus DSM 17038 TaxID=1121424 RepID=A0A1I2W1G7_9FIRM|nr:thiolase domain-containing protein [Desulfotruncus arcticus]SFG93916.1 acetyl-CoA C-acetyltransferase [Desulfotomaculum arcticum] [Desulfotruncus arcticus DSM 17038]